MASGERRKLHTHTHTHTRVRTHMHTHTQGDRERLEQCLYSKGALKAADCSQELEEARTDPCGANPADTFVSASCPCNQRGARFLPKAPGVWRFIVAVLGDGGGGFDRCPPVSR